MNKPETKKAPAALDLKSLQNAILMAARTRIAGVLKPFPEDATSEDITAALDALRAKKLVHGSTRAPNLTAAGLEAAKSLAKKG